MVEGPLYGAIEGGGSKFVCAVGSGPEHIIARTRIPTTSPDETLAAVAAFFAPHRTSVRALGLCCFGPLELDPRAPDYGSLLETPKPGWSRAKLHALLHAQLGLPIAVDTDVNGAALAEQRWGAAQGADPVVYITVGTGVGVGVVIDGKPLHGLMHPELGHLRAHDSEFAGRCPFHGACVEGLISAPALRQRTGRDPASLHDDDPLWPRVAETIAALLHAVVLAYAPRRIVLGGGVLQRAVLLPLARAALLRSLGGYVPRSALTAPHIQDYVVAARLGQEAGLFGAFQLAAR